MKEPSPEVKEILKEFVKKQKAKYGDDWKEILSKEMAEQTTPVLKGLLELKETKNEK